MEWEKTNQTINYANSGNWKLNTENCQMGKQSRLSAFFIAQLLQLPLTVSPPFLSIPLLTVTVFHSVLLAVKVRKKRETKHKNKNSLTTSHLWYLRFVRRYCEKKAQIAM